MKKIFLSILALLTLSLGFSGQGLATPITGLYYESSPQSWVGGGATVLVTPSDDFDFIASRNFDSGMSFAVNDFSENPHFWSTRWWYLDFSAPFNQLLQVGHYSNATRYPFQDFDDPGLNFSGNGRGNNQLSGYFDVREVSYGPNGQVLSFAADFTQFDENFESGWNKGGLRYNSAIPLFSVPEPHSSALLAIGIVGLIATSRDKRT